MVEAAIAFGVVVVVLVALLQLSNRSVNNSGTASRQALATAYVTEGLQWVKQERTNVAADGFAGLVKRCGPIVGPTCGAAFCLNQLGWNSGACAAGSTIPGTEYARNLTLVGGDSGGKFQLTATVTVSWWEDSRMVTADQSFIFVER